MNKESLLRIILILLGIFVIVIVFVFQSYNQEQKITKQEAFQIAINSQVCQNMNLTSTAYYDSKDNSWWIYTKNQTQECNMFCVIKSRTKRAIVSEKCSDLLL
jgi:uncharacterized protein YpmB